MDLPVNLKRIRREKHLTQAQLAELAGVSLMTIRRYEGGNQQPRAGQLLKIADALGVYIDELLYDTKTIIFNSTPDPNSAWEKAERGEPLTPEEVKKLNEYVKGLPDQLGEAVGRLRDTLLDSLAGDDKYMRHLYWKLNHTGRKEAIKRTDELTKLTEYTTPDEPDTPDE